MVEENKLVLEREYVVPLREAFRETAFYRKTPKAIKALKIFIAKHMKVEERDTDKVKIDKFLNEQMWFRGIRYPPARIKVKAKKYSNGIVTVELSEMPQALKFKAESEKRRAENKPKVKGEAKPEEKKPEEEEKPTEEKKAEKEKEESGAAQEIKATKQEAKQFKHEVAEKHQIKQPLRVSSLRK
jgi:large subunit ribosomal protein L31e